MYIGMRQSVDHSMESVCLCVHACARCAPMHAAAPCVCLYMFYLRQKKREAFRPFPLSGLIGMLIMSLWVGYQCVFVKDP